MLNFSKSDQLNEKICGSEDLFASKENFYKPLSLTGYLTPLQRKKLREKRKTLSESFTNVQAKIKVKKPIQGTKRKKEHFRSVTAQSNKKVKKKSSELVPQVQCTAAKIILKNRANLDVSCKKFFKASSPSRLEKANFTMPFVLQKNLFSNIEKCAKESIFHFRKQHSKLVNGSTVLSDSRSDIEDSVAEIGELSTVFSDSGNDDCEKINPEEKCIFDFDWPDDEVLLKRRQKALAELESKSRDSHVLLKQNCSGKITSNTNTM